MRQGGKAGRALVICLGLLMPGVMGSPAGSQESQPQRSSDVVRPGRWEIASVASDGRQGDGTSGQACGYTDGPTMSDDGRYIAFSSEAGNLDPTDTNRNAMSDIFVRDRKKGRTRLVSVGSSGLLPDPGGVLGLRCETTTDLSKIIPGAHDSEISANGRFVAWADGRQLTDDDEDLNSFDTYVRDLRKGTTELVSIASNGEHVPGDHGRDGVDISGDGRYVLFTSTSYALDEQLTGDEGLIGQTLGDNGLCVPIALDGPQYNCHRQAFVHDRTSGTTTMVSVSSDGEPANAYIQRPSISDDGQHVVFETQATNLAARGASERACPIQNENHGSCFDIYLHELQSRKTELISVDTQEETGPSNKSFPVTNSPVVTPNGRFVIFEGNGDLAPGTNLLDPGVYVRDRETGRTEQVAVTSDGAVLRSIAGGSLSDDGRYAFFTGQIFAGDTGCPKAEGYCEGELRHDRRTGQTDWIWSGRFGAQGSSIGSSGQTFLRWSIDDQPYVSGDSNGFSDVFFGDLGAVNLGVGGLLGPGAEQRLAAPGGGRFAVTGVMNVADPAGDSLLASAGADIIDASVAYRPDLADLYLRVDVERLAPLDVSFTPSAGVPVNQYGVELFADGTRYEIRIAGGLTPRFDLFRCDPSCTQVAEIRGGFGTVGDAVVAAVPLDLLNLDEGGVITDASAYSALGTFETGPTTILDRVALQG